MKVFAHCTGLNIKIWTEHSLCRVYLPFRRDLIIWLPNPLLEGRTWSFRSISSLVSAFCWHRTGLEEDFPLAMRSFSKEERRDRIYGESMLSFSFLSTPTLNGRWWSAGIPGWIRLSITIQMVQSLIYGSRKWVACSWHTSPACLSRCYGWAFQNPFSWIKNPLFCTLGPLPLGLVTLLPTK